MLALVETFVSPYLPGFLQDWMTEAQNQNEENDPAEDVKGTFTPDGMIVRIKKTDEKIYVPFDEESEGGKHYFVYDLQHASPIDGHTGVYVTAYRVDPDTQMIALVDEEQEAALNRHFEIDIGQLPKEEQATYRIRRRFPGRTASDTVVKVGIVQDKPEP